ncbi:MAG: hypothetical protein WBL40_10095 [Terrimicrobiaceae bacterium]
MEPRGAAFDLGGAAIITPPGSRTSRRQWVGVTLVDVALRPDGYCNALQLLPGLAQQATSRKSGSWAYEMVLARGPGMAAPQVGG